MGYVQSEVDNEESVTRCKERENLMEEAVAARNAFAAGHSGYPMALKNTGAALSDYDHGESDQTLDHPQQPVDTAPQPLSPLPIENFPRPPPRLPNFSPSPIKRAISMLTMPIKGPAKFGLVDSMEIEEEGEEEDEEEENEGEKEGSRSGACQEVENATPPQTPESVGGKQETTQPEMETLSPMPPPPMPEANNLQEEEEGSLQFDRTIRNYNSVTEAMEPKTPEKLEVEKDKEDKDEDEDEDETKKSRAMRRRRRIKGKLRWSIQIRRQQIFDACLNPWFRA